MKTYFSILAACVLAACSSSNGNGTTPPPPTTYSYSGTPTQATASQTQAASTASTSTQPIVSATQSGSVTDNASTLSSAPELPDVIVADVTDAVAMPKYPQAQAKAVRGLLAATRSGQLVAGCYTVAGNTITYNNCNLAGDSGYTLDITGSLTATPTNMTWDITVVYNFSSDGDTFAETGTWTGNLNFTGNDQTGSIDGTCNVGWVVTDSASGSTFDFAYTAQVIFKALNFDASCDTTYFTTGSLDISVTVTDSEFTGGFENFGIQIDWNGCSNPVTVVTGTASN
jgi:hypothetical protein